MRVSLIFICFLALAVALNRKKTTALVGLPALAILIAFLANIPLKEIVNDVISGGIVRLHSPILTIILGAALAELVKASGVVEKLIKYTAEFAGERRFALALTLFFMVSLLFTVLGGLGAIVMVGSIVLPILLSIGFSKSGAAVVYLLGISMGGMFNLTNWSLYLDVLKMNQADVLKFVLIYSPAAFFISAAMIFYESRKSGASSFRKPEIETPTLTWKTFLPFLTPLIPVGVILFFGIRAILSDDVEGAFQFPILTAMLLALIYGALVAPASCGSKTRLLSKSLFDGISLSAPAIALMMGIGMLLKSVAHPAVRDLIQAPLSAILPQNPIQYFVFFAVLSPLALYRGPLNLWGMGSGLVSILKDSGTIPIPGIMAALMAVGQIQGVSDPTNTHNVWIANFLGVSVQDLLKRTLLGMWVLAALGLILGAWLFYA